MLDDRQFPTPAGSLRNEIIWLPAAVVLLAFQAAVFVHGLSGQLPDDIREVYLSGMLMVACSVVLLLVSIVHSSHLSGTLALIALALAVAADIFVATCAATGAIPFAATVAVLIVAVWGVVWSLTEPRSAA